MDRRLQRAGRTGGQLAVDGHGGRDRGDRHSERRGPHHHLCVRSAGTAMLVDNITYVSASGQVQNLANDGSSSDIIVAAPHAASLEWSGVQAATVVIYELDTPIVHTTVLTDTLDASPRSRWHRCLP